MSSLVTWEEVPSHLQFNPYIKSGYRPRLGFWGSLCSLFYLHNETVNILSHGIPIVYILGQAPSYLSEKECRFLAACHLAGSLSPWLGSFIYHLFMNMDKPPPFYQRLLQLDMLGIWVSQSFGALPMVVTSVACLPRVLQWVVVATYSLFSIIGLFKAIAASSPWKRRMSFAVPFITRSLLILLRASRLGGGDPASLHFVVLQDLISLVGGLIGALNIPERWLPGCLDYWLNSHNIMHVLVVLAVYIMHLSTEADLRWLDSGSCSSSFAAPTEPTPSEEL